MIGKGNSIDNIMDGKQRQRGIYVTARQKKKLLEFMTKHPELVSCKVSQEFSYRDSQLLWQEIARECNSIPGARKSWRQWRKTWQDLKCKTKKRQELTNGVLPNSVSMLTSAEQEALGLKNVTSTTNSQLITEFIVLNQNNDQDSLDNAADSNTSYSDGDGVPEQKVFTTTTGQEINKLKNISNQRNDHSNNCAFNCDLLAGQEQRKIQIKEDYFNFKKDYLTQKLKLLKEQTEALKSIAKGLANK